jgi:AcrR family transcriptional regulator
MASPTVIAVPHERDGQPATVRRPGGRTARLRAAVLDATVELVARHGIAGLRYEDVAELASVHKTSIYRNWPERDRLVADALTAVADDTAQLANTGDLRADLVEYVVGVGAGLGTPRGRALVQVVEAARDSAEMRAVVDGVFERRIDVLRQRISAAVARGELPTVDPYFLAELLVGPVQQFVARRRATLTRADADRIVDVVLAGVRATHS